MGYVDGAHAASAEPRGARCPRTAIRARYGCGRVHQATRGHRERTNGGGSCRAVSGSISTWSNDRNTGAGLRSLAICSMPLLLFSNLKIQVYL